LHGYHFYYALNSSGVKVLVISKKKIKKREEADFQNLKRINDYTFIEREKNP
jgi:acyl-CoA synthetase (AMP-forming)/AMP-acid ligase II